MTGLQLPLQFDRVRLRAELDGIGPEDWIPHYNNQDYGGEWAGVPLRSLMGSARNLSAPLSAAAEFAPAPALARCRYFQEVLAAFPCRLRAVRLLRLGSGSIVHEHSDPNLGYEYGGMRIHVPIQTSSEVEFYLAGQRLNLEEGSCYYLNVSLPHRISNRSNRDRIHLVIDVEVDDWVSELIGRSTNIAVLPHRVGGFEDFRQRVFADAAIAQRLHSAPDREALLAAVLETASQIGFDFTSDEAGLGYRGGSPSAVHYLGAISRGWCPAAVRLRDMKPIIEWVYIGSQQWTEPFFEESIQTCRRNPFTRQFKMETPLNACPSGLQPAGFVFHMSRCGSTLVSRMFGTLPRIVSISEAPPIDAVVQSGRPDWLRTIILALGLPREGGENCYIVTLDSWHINSLPLFHEAFPDTPWIFLYRDPLEVMLSHLQTPGMSMLPGAMNPHLLGMNPDDVPLLSRHEWCARVLAGFFHSALARRNDPLAMFVDYRQLPDAVWNGIARHFHIDLSPIEVAKMCAAPMPQARAPLQTLQEDSNERYRQASPEARSLVEGLLYPLYRELQTS